MKAKKETTSEIDKLKEFLNKKKSYIETLGITATVTALFLQVQIESISLKYIQTLLLLTLVVVISMGMLISWYEIFIKDRIETSVSIAISMIFSGILTLFLFHLYRFTWDVYRDQIVEYFKYAQFGFIFLLYFLSIKLRDSIKNKSNRHFLINLVPEVIWLLASIFLINRWYIFGTDTNLINKIGLISFLTLLSINNLLWDAYKLYSKKISYYISGVILIVYLIVIFIVNR